MPSYNTGAIVENIGIRRRKEEAPRIHLHLSVSMTRENQELLVTMAMQMGNGVTLDISTLQGDLFESKPKRQRKTKPGNDEEPIGNFSDPDVAMAAAANPDAYMDALDRLPDSSNPLADALLAGANDNGDEPSDDDRAQAMSNLQSASASNVRHIGGQLRE